jgi:trehalose 6-phosphate phosphatase
MKYFLFLDYDGTLTPIVNKPQLAKLSKTRQKALQKLAKYKDISVAIVSGRKLANLKKMVPIKQFFFAGNHGFEIQGPKLHFTHPKAKAAKPILKQIKSKLTKGLKGIKGIIIEDKSLTLSLHFRLAAKKDQNQIKKIFNTIIAPYKKKKKIRITSGKKVFEVRPNIDWHKGKAVLWLLNKFAKNKKVIPVYIGDDVTDEDAFIALKKRGITIRVGKSKASCAQENLKDVKAVYKFIESLQRMC